MVPTRFSPGGYSVTTADLQSRLVEFFKDLLGCPLLKGRLFSAKSLTTAVPNVIYHNLGATPTGYLVLSSTVDSTFWHAAMDATTLDLRCSATTVVNLWVF